MTVYNRIFVDTSPFIYLLEGNPDYYERAVQFFTLNEEAEWITSVITYLEFCVKPQRENKTELIQDFKNLITEIPISVYPVNWEVAERAYKLRASNESLRAMDALQLSVALEHGCEVFFSNDKSLKRISEIEVVLISEL